MSVKSLRDSRRAKVKRQKRINTLAWVGGVVVVTAIFGYLIWDSARPAVGMAVPIMANFGDHVPEGTNPGPFNSNPPTSGRHYDDEYETGFYDETSPEAQVPYPEGYLGHNLEHGYVIYWYNCELLDAIECAELKDQIKESMEASGNNKLIAFPRNSIEKPVVLTSWGQMLPMDEFDAGEAKRFVSANRNRAPEPNAP